MSIAKRESAWLGVSPHADGFGSTAVVLNTSALVEKARRSARPSPRLGAEGIAIRAAHGSGIGRDADHGRAMAYRLSSRPPRPTVSSGGASPVLPSGRWRHAAVDQAPMMQAFMLRQVETAAHGER